MPSCRKQQAAFLPAHNMFFAGKAVKINKDLSLITSRAVKTPFAFDGLVLSVSARLAGGSAILAQAAVKTEDGWSPLKKLFYISPNYKKTFLPQADDYAKVDIDTLLPRSAATAFKYQITILGRAKVDSVCAALTRAGAKYDESLALETLDLKDYQLPLAPANARAAGPKLARRVCSPAALCAVLNYHGKKVAFDTVLKDVYDESAKIYGAWPLNIAAAAQYGLKAAFVRCASLAQAEGEILQGRPLIASIAYKKGQLKGAPIAATPGHLVAITGFDAKGNILAADSGCIRVYNRKQFARAWLKNKKGAAYAISLAG